MNPASSCEGGSASAPDPGCRPHQFEWCLAGVEELTPGLMDRLWAAGCDDATAARRGGKVYLTFDRVSPSRGEAMLSAYLDVKRAGFEAV